MFLGLSPFGNALLEPRGQAARVGGLEVGPEGLQCCQKGQGQPLSLRGNRGQGLAVGLQTEQGPRSPGQGRRLGPVGWVRPHSRSKSLTPAFKSSPPQPCGVRTLLASCGVLPAAIIARYTSSEWWQRSCHQKYSVEPTLKKSGLMNVSSPSNLSFA